MSRDVCIAPSVLSADFGKLAEEVAMVEEGGADWIHIDVMDGHFVPNLTFGADIIAAIRRTTNLPLDVHLMVKRPEFYISPFADAGTSLFTFHPEATSHVQRQLDQVRACGMRAGLALNPGTPLSYVDEIIDDLDMLLLMTVNPGFGAQRYIPASTKKIERSRNLLDNAGSTARLELDGGINRNTIAMTFNAGADTFVAGSAIFKAEDPGREVQLLREACLGTM